MSLAHVTQIPQSEHPECWVLQPHSRKWVPMMPFQVQLSPFSQQRLHRVHTDCTCCTLELVDQLCMQPKDTFTEKEYLHHVGKYTQNEHNLSCYYNCLVMFKNNTLRVQFLFILQCMQISHFVKQLISLWISVIRSIKRPVGDIYHQSRHS